VRVLHLHSGNIFGGIETMLVTLAGERRADASMDSSFALCFRDRLADELTRAGAPLTILGEARLTRPRTLLDVRRRLSDLLATTRPDVVLTHLPWTQVVFGGVLRAAGCRSVLWMHGPGTGWLHRIAAHWPPDAVIFNSAFTQTTMPAAYGALPVTVVHCPLRTPTARGAVDRLKTRAEHGVGDDDVVVVQASRLQDWKGHLVHLRALARLRDRPRWILWVLGGAQSGDGNYVSELMALPAQLGIADRVRFLGERSDVARFLAAADIYCQPNFEPEPIGLAYVEALAAGLPVVASDLGGAREIVDAATGVLVPAGDEGALAVVLGELIADSARRRRLGAAGASRAAELCDPERQIARLESFLRRLPGRAA
jgi:glycosyltransferase involved in cell wall biosynthesis